MPRITEEKVAIKIDGEWVDVEVTDTGRSGLAMVENGCREWYVAEDSESAGKEAREYWKDLAENDPGEFACIVGEKTLVSWGLGNYAGPGSSQVKSLEEWLDLWLDTPEEQWASYDGEECEVEGATPALVEELGFTPTVAYRHN